LGNSYETLKKKLENGKIKLNIQTQREKKATLQNRTNFMSFVGGKNTLPRIKITLPKNVGGGTTKNRRGESGL